MRAGRRATWIDDPHPIFRRGLVSCVQGEGLEVAGESAGLEPEPDLARAAVLLFDVDAVGVAQAAALARDHGVALVGLVREPREDQLYDALTGGVSGVLLRGELTPSRLTTCLRAVVEGHGSMPPGLLGQMVSGLAKGAPRGTAAAGLARREIEVLRLLAQGGSTRDIAEQLAYSDRTVKNIVHELLVKLNCRTRAHAVALATRQGVI